MSLQRIPRLIVFCLLAATAGVALAATPAAQLLPETTKGYVSVTNLEGLLQDWRATQLGQLCDDPEMRPFLDDVWQRLRASAGAANERLAITLEQVQGIAAGEVCAAVWEPEGDDSHALMLLIDVVENGKPLGQLLREVDTQFRARRAVKRTQNMNGITVTSYTVPAPKNQPQGHQAFFAVYQGKLLATDHLAAAQAVIARWKNNQLPALINLNAFQTIQKRTELQSGQVQPHIRWYVEPFGFARIVRATSNLPRQRGTDLIKVLLKQGFGVLEGVGGQIAVHTAEHEILHRSLVYAPGDRQLAARMLAFDNGEHLTPASWIPANVANYISLRWDMRGAFEASKTLVNELAGEEFFEEFLKNLEQDPNGPQVNLRRDLMQYLGHRVTFISDCRQPIMPDSERFLVAIELEDADAVASTVDQAFAADPSARRRAIGTCAVWEFTQEESEDELLLTVEVESGGFDFNGDEQPKDEAPEKGKPLPYTAVAVVGGRLLISSHLDYIKEIAERGTAPSLAQSPDYQRVAAALEQLGAGLESFRIVSRSDETYRATYELLRAGRMPESQSLLGQWLNKNAADQKGPRTQQLDGSKLPPFEAVQRYLGPAGIFVETHGDGWAVSGCLLKKE